MKKHMIASALMLALTSVAAAASASDFSTSYAEISYTELDGGYDGYSGKGSVGLGQTGFYVSGQYTSFDVVGVKLKESIAQIGYQHTAGNYVALFGEGGYYRIDVAGESVDGYTASVGARIAAGRYVEPFVKVTHTDVDELGSATETAAGLLIKPWTNFGFIGQYTFGRDGNADQWKAGIRYSF